jgi:uncharacterized membrane protein YgdD (TMEM256/DUF423 family)
MQNTMRVYGSLFMAIAIVLGAFASHYLKSILKPESIVSFEVGVRYLVYHGLALLILSTIPLDSPKKQQQIVRLFIFGSCLFSGSIFILSFKALIPFSISLLGPITPVGGGLLITAWVLLFFQFLKRKNK